ncbi:MAG: ABC transporter permease [Kiritimatiellae bacterium]|nr:ABC transporter permease [Kiritimatiellia bacterium]
MEGVKLKLSVKLALGILAVYLAAAIYGEVQYHVAKAADVTASYNEVNLSARYMPPMSTVTLKDGRREVFILGTDNLGRSVAERLVQGTRIAFHVGVMTSLIAIPLGVLLGLLGGYFRGWVDSFVVWLSATVASMPGLLFILAISLVVGQGLLGIYLGIGLTTWVGVSRTIRAEVMKQSSRAYVQAARTLGYSHARIMFRHILPNVAHIILIQFSIRFPSAISTEVFISFLGIGVQGEPSWGVMIDNARRRLCQGVWWEMTFTTIAIFVLVLVFNHLADYLRDRLDPALRNEAK